jgi:hypothetical protein
MRAKLILVALMVAAGVALAAGCVAPLLEPLEPQLVFRPRALDMEYASTLAHAPEPPIVPSGYSPAIVIRSIRIDPHSRPLRTSTSPPTEAMPLNMSRRLPAMVISSTGNWISPPSTQ